MSSADASPSPAHRPSRLLADASLLTDVACIFLTRSPSCHPYPLGNIFLSPAHRHVSRHRLRPSPSPLSASVTRVSPPSPSPVSLTRLRHPCLTLLRHLCLRPPPSLASRPLSLVSPPAPPPMSRPSSVSPQLRSPPLSPVSIARVSHPPPSPTSLTRLHCPPSSPASLTQLPRPCPASLAHLLILFRIPCPCPSPLSASLPRMHLPYLHSDSHLRLPCP